MGFEHYFPLGIAKGEAFVGRQDEVRWLQKNIQAGTHTLLLAPRRYGKSSLALYTVSHGGLDYLEMDLQLCRSAKVIGKKILHGISSIVTKTVKRKENI